LAKYHDIFSSLSPTPFPFQAEKIQRKRVAREQEEGASQRILKWQQEEQRAHFPAPVCCVSCFVTAVVYVDD